MKKQATKKQEPPKDIIDVMCERRIREAACPLLKLKNDLFSQAAVLKFSNRLSFSNGLAQWDRGELLTQRAVRIEALQAACYSLQEGISDATTKAETIGLLYLLACGADPAGVSPSVSASCPGLCTRACTDFELLADDTPDTAEPRAEDQGSSLPKKQTQGTRCTSPHSCEGSSCCAQPSKGITTQLQGKQPLTVARKTPSNKPKSS